MNEAVEKHPLEMDKERFGIKKPDARYDLQGDVENDERVRRAMVNFAKDINRTTATYMEACVHCGQCAEACQYYVQTGDPKYTPIWKLEVFKQAYKREASPFAFLYRMFNLKRKVTVEQLEEWQELIYDSCTMCGRCSLMCPMGIDIATLVGQARHGMFKAGLVPHELHAVAERAQLEGSPLGATAEVFEDRADWMADEHDTEVNLNLDQADILVAMSSIEIMKYPNSIGATARVLNALGESWTFRSEGYEATNFGMLSGNVEWQKKHDDETHRCRYQVRCETRRIAGMRTRLWRFAVAGCRHVRQTATIQGTARLRVSRRRDQFGPLESEESRPVSDFP